MYGLGMVFTTFVDRIREWFEQEEMIARSICSRIDILTLQIDQARISRLRAEGVATFRIR